MRPLSPRSQFARAFRLAALAAALILSLGTLAPDPLSAQSGDDHGRGLTGDPLVDSILQAPGPDFLSDDRHRAPDGLWQRERPRPDTPPRSDDRDQWEDEPRRAREDDWRDDAPSRSRRDDRRRPDPARTRRVERDPPPPPVQRGEGPADIIILDAEPSGESVAALAEPAAPEADTDSPDEQRSGEPDPAEEPPIADRAGDDGARPQESEPARSDEQLPPAAAGRESETAAQEQARPAQEEEPYREAPARSEAVATPAPGERRVAAAPGDAAPRAPTVPARAPERADVSPALDKMIGQMLLIGFDGQTPSDANVQRVVRQLEAGQAGGVLFMSRNIASPQQVKTLTRLFAGAAKNHPTPFVAVDQEGGYVQRLARSKGFNTHPSAERLGAGNDPQSAYSAYRRLALELREYGFNLNLGPVLDLNINPANPIIGRLKRSYGTDPDHVAAFAKAFVFAHNESGVLTAAKHFPGHGSSETDSHDALVDISKSWSEAELRPYRKLIEDDAIDMIMTGHLYHPSFSDRPGAPASLSAKAIRTVLRESLNFDGVVISDDLDMRGVRERRSFEDALISAVAAGNDMLLITNSDGYKPDLPGRAAAAIRAGLDSGRISTERIREAYGRVLKLKDELSRLQRTATGRGEDRGLADHSGG